MVTVPINTSSQSFGELFGNGKQYVVPKYQRDFSWTEEQCEELWVDIEDCLSEENADHFMGYIVLKADEGSLYEVIDGQQRITTLSLLVLATIKNIEKLIDENIDADNNKKRIDILKTNYVGYTDPQTLTVRPKLKLNKNNDYYFQTYIVEKRDTKQKIHGNSATDKLVKKAFEFFDKKITEKFKNNQNGAAFAEFLTTISNKLYFSVIHVHNELNAFKVFETLNARGVHLSPTDLLKNYLFSIVHRSSHKEEIELLEMRWEKLVGAIEEGSFTDFLRAHLNSLDKIIREKNLFKEIRSKTQNKADVFALIRDLEASIDPYLALGDANSDRWSNSPHVRELVYLLNNFRIRQHYPMLIAACKRYPDATIETILNHVLAFSMRFNVIQNLTPRDQEEIYNHIAQKITEEGLDYRNYVNYYGDKYPKNNIFKLYFETKELKTSQARNKIVVKYILSEFEKQKFSADINIKSDTYSIEHIFPEHPAEGWEGMADVKAGYKYRIGNMMLLETNLNREAGNLAFDKKRAIYAKSKLSSVQDFLNVFDHWDVQAIEKRQREIASSAVTIWKISQLET